MTSQDPSPPRGPATAESLAGALNAWAAEERAKDYPGGNWWLDVAYDHPATDHAATDRLDNLDAVATVDGRMVVYVGANRGWEVRPVHWEG